jgi:leader peptidase (prepilin peptidase)/N-methyltransferase
VTPFDVPLWIMLCWMFVLGAVLGSFLNVCIYRIPQHERLWDQLRGLSYPPSHCPKCGNLILRGDNIPIVGWLRLRGRCRFCGRPFSVRYPLVELFNGLLFAIVYWFEIPAEWGSTIRDSSVFAVLGPTGYENSWWLGPVAMLHWRYFYHMVLLEALVVASLIDFDRRIIPDGSTLPAMAVGVLGGLAIGQVHLVPVWFQDPSLAAQLRLILPDSIDVLLAGPRVPEWIAAHPHLHGLAVSIAGLVAGGGLVWAVRWIGFLVLKQEAMGFGDVVLMAAIGSFLGWQPVVIVFFLAPVCALVVVAASWLFRRDREIPYGPYLSLAVLLLLLAWKPIWGVAERVFDLGPLLPIVAVFMAGLLTLCLLATQLVKRALGIPLYDEEWVEQWTSADQLAHYAGQQVDAGQGRWRTEEWQGKASGRGTAYLQHWSRGSTSRGGLSHHQARPRGR